MILAIRTDSQQAEIYLLTSTGEAVASKTWQAGHQLSQQILKAITQLLAKKKVALNQITGIIVYRGPGSFTSLRIGISVANALAYAQQVPISGTTGEDWMNKGLATLSKTKPGKFVIPEYGALPHITVQKK